MYKVYLFSGLAINPALDRRANTLSNQQILDINRIVQGYFEKVVKAHDALPRVIKYGSRRCNGALLTRTFFLTSC